MRRYNRWWSRFDQPDPYDGSYDLADPQSLNRYSYTRNDPVNFTDPSGLDDDVTVVNVWTEGLPIVVDVWAPRGTPTRACSGGVGEALNVARAETSPCSSSTAANRTGRASSCANSFGR